MFLSEIFEDDKDKYAPRGIEGHESLSSDEEKDQIARETSVEIIKQCQPWLENTNYGEEVVYRGLKLKDNLKARAALTFTRRTRTNRKPTHSSKSNTLLYNSMVKSFGNHTALRHNSLFVSGNKSLAAGYGFTYVIFPIGEYDFTYSPNVRDWFTSMSLDDAIYDVGCVIPNKKMEKEILPSLVKRVEKSIRWVKGYIKSRKEDQEEFTLKIKQLQNDLKYTDNTRPIQKEIALLKNAISRAISDLEKLEEREEEYLDFVEKMKSVGIDAIDSITDTSTYTNGLIYDDFLTAGKIYIKNNPRTIKYDQNCVASKYDIMIYGRNDGDSFLSDAIETGVEIMLKTSMAIYIEANFYHDYVYPYLKRDRK